MSEPYIILIDNYDSFTYNLVHYVGEMGAKIKVIRNDTESVETVLARSPDAIMLSPGPSIPQNAGICNALVQAAPANMPILGVCLGHQSIAESFGGRIVQSQKILHGKNTDIHHEAQSIFAGLPSPLSVTRYHSLAAEQDSLPDCLNVLARAEDGEIMGICHKTRPVIGIQFHPESIGTEYGRPLLQNFLNIVEKNHGTE